MRILHLAFEDHRRPNSGGGAVRTHEINRRLAIRHDVTVVTARYPGCAERVEDGVRYVHAGANLGSYGSQLAYYLALPLVLRRRAADLVVEEIAPPFSSGLVPLWTRRPVVGVVQWLFAREKSRQYHLPFFVVEWLGIRAHHRFIAVSADLASRLRSINPRATVTTIHQGVDARAFDLSSRQRQDVLFLGRMEIAQKGLDLLVEAFAQIVSHTTAQLLIAGDGPDLERVRAMCRRLGILERVRFLGRVGGRAKLDLLASVQLVCMASRYEGFPLVAAEAMACASPILAFDIPCLREILQADAGVLVEAFDVRAYAAAMRALLEDRDACRTMGDAGRRRARSFDWETAAQRQEQVYLDAVNPVPSALVAGER